MGSEARTPRIQVLADGVALPGVIGATVSSNNHLAADRFRVELASGAGGLGAADAVGARFDVQVGFGGGWSSLVVGEADMVSYDPLRRVIEIEGRDLAALLIDTRVDETFANRTSSEIATVIAGRHGLDVSAPATATLVGRYYQSEHDRMTTGTFNRAMSEWDLLSFLAVQEGNDLFMDGSVLRFEPKGDLGAVTLTPGACLSLRLDHAMGMERAIEVTVRSWDQQGAQAVAQTVRGGGKGRAWRHSVVRPNLPADDAERLAQQVLDDLLRHARTVWATMPGELSLVPRVAVSLEEIGGGWDGDYTVSEVNRRVDLRHGFTQRVSLQRRV